MKIGQQSNIQRWMFYDTCQRIHEYKATIDLEDGPEDT